MSVQETGSKLLAAAKLRKLEDIKGVLENVTDVHQHLQHSDDKGKDGFVVGLQGQKPVLTMRRKGGYHFSGRKQPFLQSLYLYFCSIFVFRSHGLPYLGSSRVR